MIAEVVNALFLTYLATEYTSCASGFDKLFDFENHHHKSDPHKKRRSLISLTLLVLFINFLDMCTASGLVVSHLCRIWKVLHIPKAVIAAFFYSIALYWDCSYTVGRHNKQSKLSVREFLPRVSAAFVKILPVYPILAVLISFVFLFVINIFEYLHIPVELLNWPIYYGTLYGPFSMIYISVKADIVEESKILLPSASLKRMGSGFSNGGQRLGGRRCPF